MTAAPDTEQLVEQAGQGDARARQQLLTRHRDRLRRMVAVRLDRRLAARLDASDVVQDTLTEAARNLSDYLRKRPMPFYAWLRRLAWLRLIQLHRRHLKTGKRTVMRETQGLLPLPDESALELAGRLAASSPSHHAAQAEEQARVRNALEQLSERDREILVMLYLKKLSIKDIAAALGIGVGAVRVRHLRALERLRRVMGRDESEGRS
jgi:RNA polymerase sigma-70 factor, ECF subfamily